MLVPTVALCREFEEREEMGREMELREREMELQHREDEMGIEREMRKLELEERRANIERERRGPGHGDHRMGRPKKDCHGLLLLIAVVHILVAVWVYTDIRKLNSGSGIWIVIALLTGLLGALVYAVVRLGDERQKKS
jgi:hypothetical protein